MKADLIDRVTVASGYEEGNTAVYDVILQYRVNGGDWVDATEDNFPLTGITVTIPYPAGTDSTYDFTVMHMFTVTSQRLGTVAGEVEYPAVTKTEDGLVVTLNGLSPVVVSWKAPETTTPGATDTEDTSTTTTTTTTSKTTASASGSAKTGDEANLVLWTVLLLVACGGLATAVICLRRKRK